MPDHGSILEIADQPFAGTGLGQAIELGERRSLPERGRSARSGPAYSSSRSRIAVDSISASPSGCTRVGTDENQATMPPKKFSGRP